MPRPPAELPRGIRPTDHVSLGVLGKAFPKSKIRAALKKTGREGQRDRDLPDYILFYYVLLMIFYPKAAYKEVVRCLLDGLQWLYGPHKVEVTTTSAITQGRQRLGVEPFREIYSQVVKPIAKAETKGAHFGKWSVHAIDGTLVDLPDTEDNREYFGKSSNQNSAEAGYPKLRAVSLVECGTHVIYATELGWFKKRTEAQNNEHPDWDKTARHSEKYLASLLLPMFKKGMIILADRGFFSFELWCNAAATDAELCWRIKDDVGVNILKMLPDKSYLVTLKREKKQIEARLIEYTIAGSDEVFRLLTTITDHREADAKSLAWLYHERWEIESTYKELKKHLNLSRITMRSKTPELVQQEFLALVLVHFAVRGLMHEAALEADVDPDEISFSHSVNVIRRNLPRFGHFPPEEDSQTHYPRDNDAASFV